MSLKHKTCDAPQFKYSDEGSGSFQGYASVFGVWDKAGEAVCKGAFKRCLPKLKESGFITIAHDWNALPVASFGDAYEDDIGLFIKGDFHSTTAAQDARTIVKERLARGKSVGLSIGYFEVDTERVKEGLKLLDLDCVETGIVNVPCNPAAGVSRVKALKVQYLGAYIEEMMTWGGMDSLWSGLQGALYDCLFMEPANREENLAAADACLAEFHALALKLITALYPDDPAADLKALAAQVKSAWNLSDPKASDPPAGKEFDAQIESAHAVLADLIPRSREIAGMRAKQGRTLSAARRQDLAQLHTDLGTLLKELEPRASVEERQAAELSHLRRKARNRAGDLSCH